MHYVMHREAADALAVEAEVLGEGLQTEGREEGQEGFGGVRKGGWCLKSY